jgi:hypothetical protein
VRFSISNFFVLKLKQTKELGMGIEPQPSGDITRVIPFFVFVFAWLLPCWFREVQEAMRSAWNLKTHGSEIRCCHNIL